AVVRTGLPFIHDIVAVVVQSVANLVLGCALVRTRRHRPATSAATGSIASCAGAAAAASTPSSAAAGAGIARVSPLAASTGGAGGRAASGARCAAAVAGGAGGGHRCRAGRVGTPVRGTRGLGCTRVGPVGTCCWVSIEKVGIVGTGTGCQK